MIIVDRIEGCFAVCENDDKRFEIPLSLVPPGLREGDVLVKKGELYFKDRAATAKRRMKAAEKMRKIGF
ncbi:MAG: DUF3006 domain-containing protein [Oscillospiraceae bacterium]|nr:DUF3006 domain-containing protein [Oscillospiraceae bacterium]